MLNTFSSPTDHTLHRNSWSGWLEYYEDLKQLAESDPGPLVLQDPAGAETALSDRNTWLNVRYS